MRSRVSLLILVLALCALPALAQDNTSSTVSFGAFSFSFPASLASNVNITQFPGDPTTLEQPGGPETKHTQFVLYNGSPAPESWFDGVGGIRVYKTADFAGYDQTTQEYQNLQTLLTQRPDLAQFMVANSDASINKLPFLPTMPAAQVIRARAHFVDTPSLQGVSYVTVYRQDVSPFVGSEFLYTFQGLSSDGAYYVSAIFRLNTALFPAEIPADFDYNTFSAQFTDYLAQSIATLNNGAPEDFTPSLATLDALVQSFTPAGVPAQEPNGGVPATAVPPSGATPTVVPTAIGDATMGGLAGQTWTLTSYGDPANPQAALTDTPVTLTFSATGIAGSAGCNSYSGSFQFDLNTITVSEIIRTLMACSEPIMSQEDAYLTALQTASAFQIDGSQLQITYDGGVLTFTASAQP